MLEDKLFIFFFFLFKCDMLLLVINVINSGELINVLNDYGIDGEKLIKNNPNILAYGEKNNIIQILNFLNEIGIKVKNIVKCPSVLCMKNVFQIKQIWNYLVNETELDKIDIDSCLHILNSDFEELKKIYNYIVDNFGIDFLRKAPSVLARSSLDDIKYIVKVFKDTVGEKYLTAGILSLANPDDIKQIILLCQKNHIEITGSVFMKSAKEIEKIIEVCRENNIEITGSVFMKSAKEIEEIIKVCGENNIEITGGVFKKTAKEIEEIIEVCRENNIEITDREFIR